jgi:hypothetical protein
MQAIEDPTLRAKFAIETFGRSAGPELIPLLSQGSQGVRSLMQEADRLGITMSGPAAQAAAMLGDTIDVLKQQFVSLMVQIGTAVSGDLQAFLERVIQIGSSVIQWAKMHQPLIRLIAATGAALVGMSIAVGVLGKAFGGLAIVVKTVYSALTLLSKHPWLLIATIGTTAVLELSGAFDWLEKKLTSLTGAVQVSEPAIRKLMKDFDKLKIEATDVGDALESVEEFKIPDLADMTVAKIERELQLSTRFEPVAAAVAEQRSFGPSRTESLFDTRLAKQVFGFGDPTRIEREQLNVQKKMEAHLRDLKKDRGIPVI